MLSFLIRLGEVTVGGRASGRRLFTLAREWFPPVRPLAPSAAAREATQRALAATGIATFQELRRVYAFGRFVTADALARLERDGAVRQVRVGDLAATYYTRRARLDGSTRTTLLSPFDNLIIDRARTQTLFGMRYRMEIYVPKHLRERGYWAMPILHEDALIGTVDPRFDRARGRLEVRSLKLEPGAPRDRATRGAIDAAIADLAKFVGASEVVRVRS
jgi:uncharacterized protein YcaQ